MSCVTGVIEFMKKHEHVAEVQATGCQLVMGLCRNHTQNHQELDRVEGLDVLLLAVRNHSAKHVEVAYFGTQVLAVLSVPGKLWVFLMQS